MNKKILFLLPLASLLLVSCKTNTTPSSLRFNLPEIGTVDLHTEAQLKYINAADYTTTSGIAAGSSEKSASNGLEISWSTKQKGRNPDWYEVLVFNDVDERSDAYALVYEPKATIYNLKINYDYKMTILAHYDSSPKDKAAIFTSEKVSFKTANNYPRNLNVENVGNMRDLGGRGIKQGLIYRSARFSESDGTSNLTKESRSALNMLNIKTEIDLRRRDENGEITESPIGNEVTYYHLPMIYGGENILTYVGDHSSGHYDNPNEIKNFFNILADENNYPLDFHCSIGKDRTGCMAFLIEALCGVEEEYLYRDYLFSNFAKIGGICEMKDIDDRYGKTIRDYEGSNLQEKTYNYLNNVIGVESNKLDTIINILKA